MSERTDAYKLAKRLLDVPNADPDDDLRILSRQLLRCKEIVERQEKALQEVDWNNLGTLDLIHANRDSLLKVHEEAAHRVRKALESNKPGRRDTALEILDALNQFHPMHGENFSWPEGTA